MANLYHFSPKTPIECTFSIFLNTFLVNSKYVDSGNVISATKSPLSVNILAQSDKISHFIGENQIFLFSTSPNPLEIKDLYFSDNHIP